MKSADDPGGKSRLLVKLPTERLGGPQLGLHLDDQRCSSGGEQGEDVDRSALAVLRVGHLYPRFPAVAFEPGGGIIDQRGVGRVGKPLDIGQATPKLKLDTNVEGGQDVSERSQRGGVDLAQLELGDQGLGAAGLASKIHLAPAAALTESADGATQRKIVHAPGSISPAP